MEDPRSGVARCRRYTKGAAMSRGALRWMAMRVDGASALDGCRDLGREVALFLLDALAEREAHEAGNLRRSADVLLRRLQRRLDRQVGVHDEGLLQEHDFLEELAHAAFHHLLDDVLRLARLARLCGEDFLLAR